LNSLKSGISDEELHQAKNAAKMSIASVMENADSRLEEVGRNYINFGDLTFHKYFDRIDSVTASSINQTASKVLGGKPTLLVTGGAINLVPSVTDVAR
jgi:predicted Zn-dependent peptidase